MAATPGSLKRTFSYSSPFNPSTQSSVSSKIDCLHEQPSTSVYSLALTNRPLPFPVSVSNLYDRVYLVSHMTPLYATLNSPRGFGPPPKESKKKRKSKKGFDDEEEEEDNEQDGGVIPEVVTNRMMSRMTFSVGIPLFIGLIFFPFFYYLKVVLKIDVPTWVPFIVSFFFFGTALLGVSYGIVSSSWDPMREGSLLGWNEAQKNWPVFWQSLWGRAGKK
ncbi:hypothetical protein K2173_002819 [Erythroxylum novogranatense]|uniref:Protein PAM68, chloroplastic n=1 Tax=Erythroxylum novogranatense TaxID=1862640 RepID=A0AAV8SQW9_9ROSI|nr:hypothetical protein K2173_002819 [Erythroxylum novogranatense]